MTASNEVRAQRRCAELEEKGMPASYEEILADMIKRDAQDREREIAPAVAAPDAVLFDNSGNTFDESVDQLMAIIQNTLSQKGKTI
jgi:cytidylate kinase